MSLIDSYLSSTNERFTGSIEEFPEEEKPEPTNGDYEREWFERFFLRRRGTSQIIEVKEGTHDRLRTSRLFIRFSLKWRISGPRNDVFNDAGIRIRAGVEDTNIRTLDRVAENQRGIKDKLSDPLQFWDGRSNRD